MGQPDLAIAEPGDRGDTAIDRPPAFSAKRHLALHAAGRADFDLVHAERIALQQPSDHFRGGEGFGLRTAIGDRFLGQGFDACLDPRQLLGLIQHGAGRNITRLFPWQGPS